jgi:hypothetical protein
MYIMKGIVPAKLILSAVGVCAVVGLSILTVKLFVGNDTSTGDFAHSEISVIDSVDTTISIGDQFDVSVTNEMYEREPNWVDAGSVTTNGDSAEFNLEGLEPCKEYTVQASLGADFKEGVFTTFSTPCETTN